MQLSRHLYAIAGLAILVTATSLGSSKAQTKAPPTNVIVTNSTVPVTLSGSPSVKVASSKSDPVLVRDVDVASRTLVQKFQIGSYTEGIGRQLTVYTVPAGKRLVVQALAVRCSLGTGQWVTRMTINTTNYFYPLFFKAQGPDHNDDYEYVAHLDAPVYIAGGSTLDVITSKNIDQGAWSFSVSFNGYLEDEPVAAP